MYLKVYNCIRGVVLDEGIPVRKIVVGTLCESRVLEVKEVAQYWRRIIME